MFARPDFFNLTICTVALYMMFHIERITKLRFKILVLGIFLTLLMDLFWFFMNHTEYSEEPKADGSNEINIRRFSLLMSYCSFVLRVSYHPVSNVSIVLCSLGVLEGLSRLREDHIE
jgi:hypothetical protein